MKKRIFTLYMLPAFLLAQAGLAQVNLSNTGILYINTAADTLYTNGDFTNTSSGALTNNGNLYVKNNLSNAQASMTTGTGTLYLNGSSLQQVNGSQVFKTFNLVTNNSAGFTLNNDLDVSGAHTFSAGIIASSATPNYLIYQSGSSYSGDNDTRHVNGWVKKFGSTDFSFPVGDGVYERKAALSSLSVSSEFSCRYYKPTFSVFSLMSPLVQVKENEYWQINKQSGGTASITLNWDHSRVPMNHVLISEILVAYYTTGNWTSLGGTASGNVLTTGQITSPAVSNFGSHTLGYTNFPLRLTLTYFTGARENSVSRLEWSTENEDGVNYFTVERSFDAVNFTPIGQVQARNSGNKERYNLLDPAVFNGPVYYRLKITDNAGKQRFSKILVLTEAVSNELLKVINPVQSQIQLQNRSGLSNTYSYRILTMSGQLLQSGTLSLAGYGGAVIPLTQFYTKGIYQLELRNERETIIRKLLIE